MSTPTTAAGMAGLAAIVSSPDHALLAFDFDGVLSPIVDDPEQAQAFPRVLSALAGIGQLVGSIAIITGRPVSFQTSRDGFGTLLSIPDLTIYGQYGREKWDAISRTTVSAPPDEGPKGLPPPALMPTDSASCPQATHPIRASRQQLEVTDQVGHLLPRPD